MASGPRRPPGLTATWSPRASYGAAAAVLIAAAAWLGHHVITASQAFAGGQSTSRWPVLYAVAFAMFTAQLVLCHFDRPYRASPAGQRVLDRLNVVALVPAYNEDPAALLACVRSMFTQTRPPQTVVVVDDGSTVDYRLVRATLEVEAATANVGLLWFGQANAGKRHAQALGVNATPEADVYWTKDSDGIDDPHTLENLLQPLARPRVMSVAGVVLAANAERSLLCRLMDLWFTTGQVVERSALSTLNSVWVNSGPIAVYRASVIRDNLDGYLNETFFDHDINWSDDSLLTLYAMLAGDTVQQANAFTFALMPETVNHHTRQYLRWMRGSFIRSWWRIRYLPLWSVAWWAHSLRWILAVLSATAVVALAAVAPFAELNLAPLPWLVGIPIALGYAQTLRYLTIRRSDVSRAWQVRTWLLTPLAVVWAWLPLRGMRWWGGATWWRTDWGTRKQVEVTMVDTSRDGQAHRAAV